MLPGNGFPGRGRKPDWRAFYAVYISGTASNILFFDYLSRSKFLIGKEIPPFRYSNQNLNPNPFLFYG